ncbi:NARE ribosyltransferase, partial [Aegotheles bennettii]|nr:NARE ribosyltransferase [Aegotheles bennettii]
MRHLVVGWMLLAVAMAPGTPPPRQDLNPIEEVMLDMAPNSFDDQYRGCSRLMEKKLRDLNRTEFANNSVYAQAWAAATIEWRNRRGHVPVPPRLRPEQAVAIMAYTAPVPLHRTFNRAVRQAGRSLQDYMDNFHFKVLHFLLTQALSTLRDAWPRRCHQVYRGVQGVLFTARRGDTVRFGHFTSTSLHRDSTTAFGQDTFFSVWTCYGIAIRNFSFFPMEEEILIPPFEMFKVTGVTREGDKATIKLESQDVHSEHNCEFLKGE